MKTCPSFLKMSLCMKTICHHSRHCHCLRAGVGMRLNVSCAPVCQSDRGVIRGIKGIEGGLSLRARIHNEIKAPGAPQ